MKVLIAEDDPVSALALRRALGDLEVVLAADGAEAWERVRSDPAIRLVLSDWMMPGLDGLELCGRVRALEDRPYTYVILLTSRAGRSDRLAALDAGVDDFLAKPVDRVELAARLTVARRILTIQEELRARSLELESLHAELERRNEQLAELATTDSLTGLKNHRYFHEALDDAFALARRHGLPLSAVMIDVDQFKRFNDTFGHPAGDEVLRSVARTLRDHTRGQDVVARYGGEEFALLLPATDAEAAVALCERLRAAIEAGPWPRRPVTASFGVATRSGRSVVGPQLVSEADRALYRAKAEGRNRVVHHDALVAHPQHA